MFVRRFEDAKYNEAAKRHFASRIYDLHQNAYFCAKTRSPERYCGWSQPKGGEEETICYTTAETFQGIRLGSSG